MPFIQLSDVYVPGLGSIPFFQFQFIAIPFIQFRFSFFQFHFIQLNFFQFIFYYNSVSFNSFFSFPIKYLSINFFQFQFIYNHSIPIIITKVNHKLYNYCALQGGDTACYILMYLYNYIILILVHTHNHQNQNNSFSDILLHCILIQASLDSLHN